jgi:hypothetical protein
VRLNSFKIYYSQGVNVSFWILLFNSFHGEGMAQRARRWGGRDGVRERLYICMVVWSYECKLNIDY